MTAVFVLRHPETTWNVAHRYQGRLESPLSTEGQVQARLVPRLFAGHMLDAVYSSPLQRALVIAQDIAKRTSAELRTDQRLTEIGQSSWEGLTLSEIQVRYPELYEEWYMRPDRVRFPRGETVQEVQSRARSVMHDVYARHPSGNVVVVTHSVVIQVLVAEALSLDLRHIHQIRVSNGGISIFCGVEVSGSLLELNNTRALYRSPLASALAQNCSTWKRRKVTQ